MNQIGVNIDQSGVWYVDEDITIEADCPVAVHDRCEHVQVIGTKNDARVRIVLKCRKETQPCIGHCTNDEMSYGRWERGSNCLKKITLQNVDVICVTYADKPFSLGSYGYAEVPGVVLENASLECPEMHGERHILHNAIAPEGSTKVVERMQYCICKSEEDLKQLMTPEQREWRDKIAEKYPKLAETLTAANSVKSMQHFLDCVKWNEEIDTDYWFKKTGSSTYWMTLRTCVILGMDLSEAGGVEFQFECAKANHIMQKYFEIPYEMLDKADISEVVADLMKYWKENYTMNDEAYEFLYECIPTYYHEFEPSERTHKEEVEAYFEAMQRGGFNWYQYIRM